jgi:hypothetical protein
VATPTPTGVFQPVGGTGGLWATIPNTGHLAAPIGCGHRSTMLWILGIIAFALGIAANSVVMKNIGHEFTTLRKRVVELEAHAIATADKMRMLEAVDWNLNRKLQLDKEAHNDLEVVVGNIATNQDLISQVLEGKVDIDHGDNLSS